MPTTPAFIFICTARIRYHRFHSQRVAQFGALMFDVLLVQYFFMFLFFRRALSSFLIYFHNVLFNFC